MGTEKLVPFSSIDTKNQFHKYDQMFHDMGRQIELLFDLIHQMDKRIKSLETREWSREDVETDTDYC